MVEEAEVEGGMYAFGGEVFVPELAFTLTNEILYVVFKIVCLVN